MPLPLLRECSLPRTKSCAASGENSGKGKVVFQSRACSPPSNTFTGMPTLVKDPTTSDSGPPYARISISSTPYVPRPISTETEGGVWRLSEGEGGGEDFGDGLGRKYLGIQCLPSIFHISPHPANNCLLPGHACSTAPSHALVLEVCQAKVRNRETTRNLV